jgi:FlaG/FlaF family flagellin (archaellin)
MRNTQHKGDTATAQCIATFTKKGYDVLIPLTESAAYDLVLDTGKTLVRVQVKYSSGKEVDLRNIHSNAKGYVVKKTKESSYDWLYVLHESGEEYLIKKCLNGRRSITFSDDTYKLAK